MAINFKVNSEFKPLILENKRVNELKSLSIRFQEQLSQVLNTTQSTEILNPTVYLPKKFNAQGTLPESELSASIADLNLQKNTKIIIMNEV